MTWRRSRNLHPGRGDVWARLGRGTAYGRLAPLLAAVAALAVGCAGPCDDLADQACGRLGESAATCIALRARAAAPADEDRLACNAGEAFAHELQRSR